MGKSVEETLAAEVENSSEGGDQILSEVTDSWQAREIGALWVRQSKSGDRFMSGEIKVGGEKVGVVVYKNKFKKAGDSTPEFRIYVSKPSEQ